MQKRIYGVETEYGIIFTPEGRKTLPVEKAIRFLFEKLITTEPRLASKILMKLVFMLSQRQIGRAHV